MRRLSILLLLILTIASFNVVGCGEKTCNQLLQDLVSIHNDIVRLQEKMQKARANDEVNEYIRLQQQELNARARFDSVTQEYIEKKCVERTGEPPILPAPLPAGETLFE